MTIAAIETQYAGCRFRSRLEARWAVAFDAMDIAWEYEPQGYKIGYPEDQRWYLPDFYLPKLGTWVEVKGSDDQMDYETILRAAVPHYGLPLDRDAFFPHLLVLGPVPRPGEGWEHMFLDFHKGDVSARGCVFWTDEGRGPGVVLAGRATEWLIGNDGPMVVFKPSLTTARPAVHHDSHVSRAYKAARSARFEHGQTP